LNQKFFGNERTESSSEDLSKTDEADTVQSLRELLQEVCKETYIFVFVLFCFSMVELHN